MLIEMNNGCAFEHTLVNGITIHVGHLLADSSWTVIVHLSDEDLCEVTETFESVSRADMEIERLVREVNDANRSWLGKARRILGMD